MNRARHDLELKLTDEIERNRSLQDIVRLKEEQIIKRQQELEDADRKVIDLERNLESLEIRKAASERQFELQRKQMNEQLLQVQDMLKKEKETRDLWIDRHEKE